MFNFKQFEGRDAEEKESLNIPEKEAAELSLAADRNLEEYKYFLRLTDEDLSEKRILDLGSGQAGKFADETEKQYPDTKVISFDFSFNRQENDKIN